MVNSKIIDSIEDKLGKKFSILKIENLKGIYSYLRDKKINKLYESSIFKHELDLFKVYHAIYKTIQPFYLEVINDYDDIWTCKIHYDIQFENEVKLFTKQLIKDLKK
jgi:hypothetical protein